MQLLSALNPTPEVLSRGGEVESRLAHNQEVEGAIPSPATNPPKVAFDPTRGNPSGPSQTLSSKGQLTVVAEVGSVRTQ